MEFSRLVAIAIALHVAGLTTLGLWQHEGVFVPLFCSITDSTLLTVLVDTVIFMIPGSFLLCVLAIGFAGSRLRNVMAGLYAACGAVLLISAAIYISQFHHYRCDAP